MFKESVEFNLLSGSVKELIYRKVTVAAFSTARYKIKYELFKELSLKTLSCYLKMPCKKRWKGLLAIAIDGSMGGLPSSKDIESYFGVYSTNKYGRNQYMSRLLMVYDVLNEYVLSGCISKACYGESRLMMDCIGELAGKLRKYIYVMDRNFDSFSTIKSLLKADPFAQLCVRLSSRSNFYKLALANPKDDLITVWRPSKKETESCRAKGIETSPMWVRVTKIRLSSGEIEILVSTLRNQTNYSKEDLATLYSLRWGVEEGFKNLKPKMKLEYYGCKKTAGVFQEFYAHIFMMNLVALHGMIANLDIEEQTSQRKYHYTYNWKNGYRFMRASLVKLLSEFNKIGDHLERLINCFQKSIIPIKPERSFVRDLRWNNVKTRITPYNK